MEENMAGEPEAVVFEGDRKVGCGKPNGPLSNA